MDQAEPIPLRGHCNDPQVFLFAPSLLRDFLLRFLDRRHRHEARREAAQVASQGVQGDFHSFLLMGQASHWRVQLPEKTRGFRLLLLPRAQLEERTGKARQESANDHF